MAKLVGFLINDKPTFEEMKRVYEGNKEFEDNMPQPMFFDYVDNDVITTLNYNLPDYLVFCNVGVKDLIAIMQGILYGVDEYEYSDKVIVLLSPDTTLGNNIANELRATIKGLNNISVIGQNVSCEDLYRGIISDELKVEAENNAPLMVDGEVVDEIQNEVEGLKEDEEYDEDDFEELEDEEEDEEEEIEEEDENGETQKVRVITKTRVVERKEDVLSRPDSQQLSRSLVYSLFSRKGGTGKTTLIREMARIHSGCVKRTGKNKKKFQICVVDLDFERGSLRTQVGLTNTSKNINGLIDYLLDNRAKGTPLERIGLSTMQLKNYLNIEHSSVDNVYYLITAQGGISRYTLDRIYQQDGTGKLFIDIINFIISAVRKSFDLVLLDLPPYLDEISMNMFNLSSEIIYLMTPNMMDLENFKTFIDDLKGYNRDDLIEKVKVVKNMATSYNYPYEQMGYIDFHKEEPVENKFFAKITYSPKVCEYNGVSGSFAVDKESRYGKEVKILCMKLNKYLFNQTIRNKEEEKVETYKDYVLNKKKKKLEKKMSNKQKTIEALKNPDAVKPTQKVEKPLNEAKNEVIDAKEEVVNTTPTNEAVVSDNKVVENTNTNDTTENTNSNEVSKQEVSTKEIKKVLTIGEFIRSDLSNYTGLGFVQELKTNYLWDNILRLTEYNGFPIIQNCPISLPKKSWKEYLKLYSKAVKENDKMRKAGMPKFVRPPKPFASGEANGVHKRRNL